MYGEMYALSYTKKPSLMLASLSICLLDCLIKFKQTLLLKQCEGSTEKSNDKDRTEKTSHLPDV